MKRVTIAGGGLAGLALGLRLAGEGVPVRLHEAGRLPRHRVCGEFLTGLDGRVREGLGIGSLLEEGRRLGGTCWFIRERKVLRRRLPEPAIGLSRHRIDHAMARRLEASGAELCWNSRYTAGPAEGVVLATGRRPDAGSPWIGVKAHCLGLDLEADLELHLGDGGYAGASPVEDGRVNVCGLFPKEAGRGRRDASLLPDCLRACGLGGLARRVQAAETVADSVCAVAGMTYGQPEAPAEGAIGDRAALIPPFTGHGMALALESGYRAAVPLRAWAENRLSWSATLEALTQLEAWFHRRRVWANRLHGVLLDTGGVRFLAILARTGLLPFRTAYRLTHR